MSQVSRYAAIRKIQLKDLRARAQARFHIEGSVLADTLHSRCDGIEIEIGFRSDADRETISHMLRTCENSCYVLQSLVNPISVRTVAMVNGQRLDLLAETTA